MPGSKGPDDHRLQIASTAAEQAHDAIVVWDLDDGIQFWNRGATTLYGWTSEDALGRSTNELYQTSGDPADLASGLAEGYWEGQLVHTTRDGRSLIVQSRQSLLELGDRRLVVETSHDITAAKQADDVRDTFIEMLSHELRTPVTTIYGGGQMLLKSGLDDEQRAGVLQDMVAESERLQELVENLLVLAKAERGVVELAEREPVVLRKVIADVVDGERQRIPDADFVVQVDPGLPLAAGDAGAIQLIVRNLVSNGLKYGARPPIVTVVARSSQGIVEIDVADNGPGIPPDQIGHIFELFFRSSEAKRSAPGSGIGLYVARVLAEAMGGSVRAGNSTNGGAVIGFSIPAFLDTDP